MFSQYSTEVSGRFLASRKLLGLAQSIETSSRHEAALCKGLMFVQIYGAYEFAVRSGVQGLLALIQTDGLSPRMLHMKVLTLVLDAKFKAVAEAGRRRIWDQRLALLAETDSAVAIEGLDDTLFPSDGSHYRIDQLQTIWKLFGITTPVVPQLRLLGRIEELVENRNAIAHGRRTADEVGGRYSTQDIGARIDDIESVALYVLNQLEGHYSSGGVRR